MKVTYHLNGNATVSLSQDELRIIRYALTEGVSKLQSTARFFKATKDSEADNAKATADKASAAEQALEDAAQKGNRCRKTPKLSRG